MNDLKDKPTYATRCSHEALINGIFGKVFTDYIEPKMYHYAERITSDMIAKNWHFYKLSNDGFYMAPAFPSIFLVKLGDGAERLISADALGIASCLISFYALRRDNYEMLGLVYSKLYDCLLEYANGHQESHYIFRILE